MGASRQAIEYHYDLGREFYGLWLDPSLTYSAAMFAPDLGLEAAQARKIDFHLDNVDITRCARLLDVGCGWGGVLTRAVERRPGLKATGLTLSPDQAAHVDARGLPGVKVRLEDWRGHAPEGRYDGIVTIGAFEHFAGPGLQSHEKIAVYREFFRTCRTWGSSPQRSQTRHRIFNNSLNIMPILEFSSPQNGPHLGAHFQGEDSERIGELFV
ncbi:MAG: class I SAM-dependent methyltransferase [Phenylobacterium sp.]|nr:class I SAM-dependent methyltransferase [Phenylobacterium sp.]